MNNISPDLVWMITKQRSAFLVKRNGVQFSSEPGNVANRNAFKYSGLANPKTVDVRPSGKGLALVLKTKKAQKPSKSTHAVTLNKSDLRAASKTLSAVVDKSFYRRDLTAMALKRVAKLSQASVRANKIKDKKFKVVYGRKGPTRREFTFVDEAPKASTAAATESDIAMTLEPDEGLAPE
jgi:large subunit ribosomal protein L28e